MNRSAALRWPETLPRHWCAGDAFETRLLEAMSLLAPEVERFVIAAVRDRPAGLGGGALESACCDFIHEEAGHSRVHHAFNRRLVAQGIDPGAALGRVRRSSDRAIQRLPAHRRLALAAACEHLSALLSLAYLSAARRSAIPAGRTVQLFDHHARDELAHRAFVFDLLRETGGSGWFARAASLAAVSLFAAWAVLRVLNELLKVDGPRRRRERFLRGVLRLIGSGRWVSPAALMRGWLSYLRPGFHPSHLPDG